MDNLNPKWIGYKRIFYFRYLLPIVNWPQFRSHQSLTPGTHWWLNIQRPHFFSLQRSLLSRTSPLAIGFRLLLGLLRHLFWPGDQVPAWIVEAQPIAGAIASWRCGPVQGPTHTARHRTKANPGNSGRSPDTAVIPTASPRASGDHRDRIQNKGSCERVP